MIRVFIFHSLPDYGRAIESAENIFMLLNKKSLIENQSNEGDKIVSKHIVRILSLLFFFSPISVENSNLMMFISYIQIDLNQLFFKILNSISMLVSIYILSFIFIVLFSLIYRSKSSTCWYVK